MRMRRHVARQRTVTTHSHTRTRLQATNVPGKQLRETKLIPKRYNGKMDIGELISDWSQPDLDNLARILDLNSTSPSPGQLKERIFRLYNHPLRAETAAALKNTARIALGSTKRELPKMAAGRDCWKEPTYDELLCHGLKIVRADEKNATTEEREQFLVQALFVRLLASLKPRERAKFFEASVDMSKVAQQSGGGITRWSGQVSAVAALSLAQGSGFGIYLFSTTVLGAITNLLGIALPFAVYTGLTSFIAFAIGPAGWSVVAFSILKKLTDPNWKKLLPALVYIITVRHRPAGQGPRAA